jgi:hypothetical protein
LETWEPSQHLLVDAGKPGPQEQQKKQVSYKKILTNFMTEE